MYYNQGRKILPNKFDLKRKQDFNFNIGALMSNNEIITYMKEELDVLSLFDNNVFEDLVNKNKSNHRHGEKLYGLFVLGFLS